ncbi:hypothetical protein [Clostridium saccharoperbutylacetonicum]|uniref:hypothetical protein n=1 Tax=Clostridium saccharoperbutylacetonicum TaxID=36745 RepID=UPI0039E8C452
MVFAFIIHKISLKLKVNIKDANAPGQIDDIVKKLFFQGLSAKSKKEDFSIFISNLKDMVK